MGLNSIEQEWQEFASLVFRGFRPSETQKVEMRKAFFAGAYAMLSAAKSIGDPSVSEASGIAYMQAREDELIEFERQLRLNYAKRN